MKNITDQHSEYIISQINLGKSSYAIAKDLRVDKSNVLRFLRRSGLESQHKCTVDYNNLMKDHKQEIIQMYESGMSGNEISKKLGFSSGQITTMLNQNSIQLRPNNTYNLDETFFEKIDTQEKAYVLGWWYSDGNVMESGTIRIAIQQSDEEILQKIKKILKYDGPFHYKKAREEHHQPQIELCINRQKMAQDLIKLGCHPNKSMNLMFPTLEQVPIDLVRHFVRGYFDGDGSVDNGVTIVGTWDFCQELKQRLPCKITNIYQRYKDRPLKESSHQLFIGKSYEVEKFYHWIYMMATIWLPRKKEKFGI